VRTDYVCEMLCGNKIKIKLIVKKYIDGLDIEYTELDMQILILCNKEIKYCSLQRKGYWFNDKGL